MVTLVFSADPFLAHKGARKEFALAKKEAGDGMSIDLAEQSFLDLYNAAASYPLFGDKKAILALNCPETMKKGKKNADAGLTELIRLIEAEPTDLRLVISLVTPKLDEKKPLFAAIKKHGKIKEVAFPKDADCRAYLDKYLAASGSSIEKAAADELLARVGSDYGRFLNEVAKLSAFASGERLTPDDVKTLVAAKEEDNSFLFIDSLLQGDARKSLKLYESLKRKGYEEVGLLSAIASQFRFLDLVEYLDSKGMDEYQIAQVLSSPAPVNPYRVKVSLSKIARISPKALENALEGCYQAQLSILKGQSDPELAFTRFICNLEVR